MSLCYALTGKRLLGGVVGFSGHLFTSFEMKNKGKALLIQIRFLLFCIMEMKTMF